jgi:hypothetical protein
MFYRPMFQFDGPEGAFLMALAAVLIPITIIGFVSFVIHKCKGIGIGINSPVHTFLNGRWKGKQIGLPLLFFCFVFIPAVASSTWLYLSISNFPNIAHVDELYYLEIQNIKNYKGVVEPIFIDNKGRFVNANYYGDPEGKIARKRVFRGRSYGISWESMEFDLVEKGVNNGKNR